MTWLTLAALLLGISIGIILAIKMNLGVDNVFKGRVKIKQRGRDNEQAPNLKAEITPNTKPLSRRKQRLLDKAKLKD